jgi:hypothetical protein
LIDGKTKPSIIGALSFTVN